MKEHGTLFKAEMVRALLRQVDPKTQTRRLFTRQNSLVDGVRASPTLWADLDFNEAWVDKGPSPAGNAGPYLKVPRRSEDSVHRVYSTVAPGDRFWVREGFRFPASLDFWSPVAIGEKAVNAGYRHPWCPTIFEADGHRTNDWIGFETVTPGGHMAVPGRLRASMHLPRWAARIELEVAAVRIERLQQIGAADAIAEGITLHADHHHRPDDSLYGPVQTYRDLWQEIHGADSWVANPFVRVFEFGRIKP